MANSSNPNDGLESSGLVAVKLAQDTLARRVLANLPDGYERVELDYSAVGGVAQASTWATKSDASEISFRKLTEILTAARELRSTMYRTGSGTWFSMKMTVTAKRSVDVEFNYDEPPWSNFEYAPDAYTSDQLQFPRDDAHIPDWLRDRLDADRSDLELR